MNFALFFKPPQKPAIMLQISQIDASINIDFPVI